MALIWDIYDEMVALGMIPNRIEIDSGRLELDYVIPESIRLRVRARDVREKFRRRVLSTCQECGRPGMFVSGERWTYALCGIDYFRLWMGWGLPRSELKW